MDFGGVSVWDFCRVRGARAVRSSKARLLDESRDAGRGRLSVVGQHAAGRPSTGQVAVPTSRRRQGRWRRRVRTLRRWPAGRAGLRCPRGRGRARQRRIRRGGWSAYESRTGRGGRRLGGGRAADHDRVRGRAHHVAGGRGQPSADRLAVDGGEAVCDHRGGHVRVRPTDGRLADQSVRGTVCEGVVAGR